MSTHHRLPYIRRHFSLPWYRAEGMFAWQPNRLVRGIQNWKEVVKELGRWHWPYCMVLASHEVVETSSLGEVRIKSVCVATGV